MLQMYHHPNPVPNRTHKKSSTGCKACKIRKVKCDEARPVCKKCSIHFSNLERCDYEQPIRRSRKGQAKKPPNAVAPVLLPVPNHVEGTSPFSNHSLEPGSSVSGTTITDSESDTENTRSANQFLSGRKKMPDWAGDVRCKCPCHTSSENAEMLSDALFGICRICGNFPRLSTSIEKCCPVVSADTLRSSSIDPFHVLPVKSLPGVQRLMHHWVNTLALRPTKIHTQYCTNPTWLSAAITNPALFNVTLYVSSLHIASLRSLRETPESLYYKSQTIQCLNECISDSKLAMADETIASVLLLLFIVCVIGDEKEVEAHIRGLRQMIVLRGGIHDFTIDGVFLHMLCTTNHLTAVLDESPSLHPPSGLPISSRPCFPYLCPTASAQCKMRASLVWKYFGIKVGFHPIMANVLHELSYAYSVVDAFTLRLLPHFREEFKDIEKGFCAAGEFMGDRSHLLGAHEGHMSLISN